MRARTKLRLLLLPQLVLICGLLAFQWFVPLTGPGPHWLQIAISLWFVFCFATYLFWWKAYGRFLSAKLVHEMRLEESHESFGNQSRSVEDRLDELDRLKRREMVTPEEYATKRQDILKDL